MTYRDGASEQFGSSSEIDVLWITAGLGCDGDTIAITAATQPSLEELVLGAIPGIPRVNFHNPFLSYENGEEFMELFHRAADGKLKPFILVVEGSIPNENNKAEGYSAAFGTNRITGQPIPTCEWIDRLAPKAWAVVAAGTCSTYGGIHAMEGKFHSVARRQWDQFCPEPNGSIFNGQHRPPIGSAVVDSFGGRAFVHRAGFFPRAWSHA